MTKAVTVVTTGISSFITGTGSAMCDSNAIRRVSAAHLAAEATQQRPTFTSDALAAIKHFRQCCAADRQGLMPKPHLYNLLRICHIA